VLINRLFLVQHNVVWQTPNAQVRVCKRQQRPSEEPGLMDGCITSGLIHATALKDYLKIAIINSWGQTSFAQRAGIHS